MNINELHNNHFHDCGHNHIGFKNKFKTLKEAVMHYDPFIKINFNQFYNNQILNEANYKELSYYIDPDFLKQGIRAAELKTIKFQNIENNTMNFLVNSSEYHKNGIQYLNRIRFSQWDEMGNDKNYNAMETARLLIWAGDIQLHCTCPSFLYWGYQYILTQLDSSIEIEERPPVKKNPQQRGIVCKHLNRVLKVFPFYSGVIAKAVNEQFR